MGPKCPCAKCLAPKRTDAKCSGAKCPGPECPGSVYHGPKRPDPTCSSPKRAAPSKAHMPLWRFCCALAIEYKCRTSNINKRLQNSDEHIEYN